ncbi:MAG: 16S rRNA (adenine(1518)-N(6)/adenine(1519)-N(6))-dimethyltransferase RsmA [Candidatus Paceibacterota bacterium]
MLPKKSLGQNFLTSIPARMAIVAAGRLLPTDTVLEIGPGKGFLTKGILEAGATVVALEKDQELLPLLTENFPSELQNEKLLLVEGDALTFDPADHKSLAKGYKLIANIPYYITGAILRRYLSDVLQPTHMVVLVQKEVAERIVARDGKESILSLAVKAYGDPKLVYRVNKGSFNPIPTVDSAVLSVENISRKNFDSRAHEDLFFTIVKSGFAHKRKFLISNLKEGVPKVDFLSLFQSLSLSEKVRAEDVPLSEWLSLSKLVKDLVK